jgi:hypothetical protein
MWEFLTLQNMVAKLGRCIFTKSTRANEIETLVLYPKAACLSVFLKQKFL